MYCRIIIDLRNWDLGEEKERELRREREKVDESTWFRGGLGACVSLSFS